METVMDITNMSIRFVDNHGAFNEKHRRRATRGGNCGQDSGRVSLEETSSRSLEPRD